MDELELQGKLSQGTVHEHGSLGLALLRKESLGLGLGLWLWLWSDVK